MLIHFRKIFNCKVSFKCCCQCSSRTNFGHSCDQITFRRAVSKKLPEQQRKLLSSKYSFAPLVLDKKNKNQNTKYYGTFTPFKRQLSSKKRDPFSSCLVQEVQYYIFIFRQSQSFFNNCNQQSKSTFNVWMKTVNELYVFLTGFILCCSTLFD